MRVHQAFHGQSKASLQKCRLVRSSCITKTIAISFHVGDSSRRWLHKASSDELLLLCQATIRCFRVLKTKDQRFAIKDCRSQMFQIKILILK